MNDIKIVLFGCLAIVVSGGCDVAVMVTGEPGSGVSATEDRAVSDFDKIDLSGSGILNVDYGKQVSLSVTSDDNLLPFIETKVDNNVLTIRTTKNIRPTTATVYDVSTKNLNRIALNGSGKINVDNFAGETLEFRVSGSGKIYAVGTANDVRVEISGSGNADLSDLIASNARIEISGSGNAIVNASQKLDVSISGSGKIEYMGSPKINQRISGSGKVREIKSKPRRQQDEKSDDASTGNEETDSGENENDDEEEDSADH